MYLIIDNLIENNANQNNLVVDQHNKVIDLKLSKVTKSQSQGHGHLINN